MANEIGSIQRRLNKIKRLAAEYFNLPDGTLIDRHAESLRVFDVRGSIHTKHPHKMARVYITRRALKHIVESRKKELLKHHGHKDTLGIICFAIDRTQETITNFDKYEYEPPTHFYIKDYASDGKPLLRIALDAGNAKLEIKSIHFKKRNKNTTLASGVFKS